MFYVKYTDCLGFASAAQATKAAKAVQPVLNMATKPKKNEPASYEAALQELEQLLAQIESCALPLDQLLAGYQRGAELLAFCRARLQTVQEQIQVLDNQMSQPLPE